MKYYFIAGEASGDKQASIVIKSLLALDPHAEIKYWGGDEMEAVVKSPPIKHIKELAFMGFVEVVYNIFKIKKNFTQAQTDILSFKPDVVVLVDYPGFNLRLAAKLHGSVPKLVYFISPSVWAWHKSRVYDIKKYIDLMICILPFEVSFYNDYKVNAVYYGNPLRENISNYQAEYDFKEKYNLTKPIIALLPGSRIQEITRILPEMYKAVAQWRDKYDIVIAQSSIIDDSVYLKIIGNKSYCSLVKNEFYPLLNVAELAIVTSGTATLETAFFNVPQIVCYKASEISFRIAKFLVKLKYISLVNLIADKQIVIELLQQHCNADNITQEIQKLSQLSKTQRTLFYRELNDRMGETGSAQRIAQAVKS